MRQPVRERRAVVEDELVVAVGSGLTLIDRRLEGPVALPPLEDGALERRKVGLRIDLGVGHPREAIDAVRLGSRTLVAVAELAVGDVSTDEQPIAVVVADFDIIGLVVGIIVEVVVVTTAVDDVGGRDHRGFTGVAEYVGVASEAVVEQRVDVGAGGRVVV